MWRNTRMIMLTAVVAALFAAVLLPFKGFQIIPGVSELRPANVLPVVFGLMFGPAGAWGVAIGNLVGDVFGGTFGPGSAFGFAGNFLFGFLSYKLWGNLGPLSSGEEPTMNSPHQVLELAAIGVAGSTVCAATIAWGLEVLQLFPFSVPGTFIALNNIVAAVVLGPPLLYLVYPRVKAQGLLYPDVMYSEDISTPSHSRQVLAATGLFAVSVVWLLLGLGISLNVQGVEFLAQWGETAGQGGSTPQIVVGTVAFLAVLALGAVSGSRLPSLISPRSR